MRLYDGRRFYLSGIQQSGAMGNPAIIPMWRRQALGLASPEAAGTQGQLGGLQGQGGGAQTGGLNSGVAGGSTAGGSSPSTGQSSGGGLFGLTGRDIAQTAGSAVLGGVGTLAAGPFGGLLGGGAGRLIGGALYDYFGGGQQGPTAAQDMAQTGSDIGQGLPGAGIIDALGAGALSGTQAVGLGQMADITGGGKDVGNLGGSAAGGGPGSGIGGGTGVEPSGGLDSTSGGGYRRGGRTMAKHHQGALSRRLKGKRR